MLAIYMCFVAIGCKILLFSGRGVCDVRCPVESWLLGPDYDRRASEQPRSL